MLVIKVRCNLLVHNVMPVGSEPFSLFYRSVQFLQTFMLHTHTHTQFANITLSLFPFPSLPHSLFFCLSLSPLSFLLPPHSITAAFHSHTHKTPTYTPRVRWNLKKHLRCGNKRRMCCVISTTPSSPNLQTF